MNEDKNVIHFKVSISDIIFNFLLIFIYIGVFTLPFAIVRYFTTKLRLENDVLIGEIGLIRKQTMHTKVTDHISVSVDQGLFGRLFNYGDIIIQSSTSQYVFRNMADPNSIRKAIIKPHNFINQ